MSVQAAAVPRARRTGFVMIDNDVVDSCDLSPHAMSLYVILARHVNHETGLAFPSLTTLCRLAQMARATVVKYLNELETKGWVRVFRSRKSGSRERAVNQYQVLNPAREDELSTSGSRREPPAPPPRPAGPGGSSNGERGVVQAVNDRSSAPEQGVVHDLNGNETEHKNTQEKKTDSIERGPTLRADADDEHAHPSSETPPGEMVLTSKEIWEDFCTTLADVCAMDYDANQRKIKKTASKLWKNGRGYTADDLKIFKAWWYKHDWRGVKKEFPTLQHVAELLRAALEAATRQAQDDDPMRYVRGYENIIHY